MKKVDLPIEAKKDSFAQAVSLILEDAQGKQSIYSKRFTVKIGDEKEFFRLFDVGSSLTGDYFEPRRAQSDSFLGGSKEGDGFCVRWPDSKKLE